MKYIYSDDLSAIDNMILDSYLTQKSSDEYIRLYKWTNPTISLGITNNKSELNLDYIKAQQINIVYRETGGGIVFHNSDLCFSVIMDKYLRPKENYSLVKNIIEKLLVESGEVVTKTYNMNIKSSICFDGSNQHEISVDNKKIIGIAQKIIKNRYLIQGSVQIKTTSLKQLLNNNNKTIMQYGLNNIDFDTIKDKMYDNFAKIYKLNNILDVDIIKTEGYLMFKKENYYKFKDGF